MPKDILNLILFKLAPCDLLKIARINKHIHNVTKSDYFRKDYIQMWHKTYIQEIVVEQQESLYAISKYRIYVFCIYAGRSFLCRVYMTKNKDIVGICFVDTKVYISLHTCNTSHPFLPEGWTDLSIGTEPPTTHRYDYRCEENVKHITLIPRLKVDRVVSPKEFAFQIYEYFKKDILPSVLDTSF